MSSPESPAEGADLSDFGWSGRKEEGEREDSGESAGDGGIGLGGGKRNGEGEEDKVMMVIKTGGGGEERTGFNGEKEGLKRGKSGNRRRRKRKGEESGKKWRKRKTNGWGSREEDVRKIIEKRWSSWSRYEERENNGVVTLRHGQQLP